MVMSSSLFARLRVFLRSYSVLNRYATPMPTVKGKTPKSGIQKRSCTVKAGPPSGGVEKSGETSGTFRETSDAFGRYAANKEEGYFYKKQREQLEKIKRNLAKQEEELGKVKAKEEPPPQE